MAFYPPNPVPQHSAQAALHNREEHLIWHWTLLLHQLKYLDVCDVRLQFFFFFKEKIWGITVFKLLQT